MQSDSCWQERVPEGAGPGPETPQVCVCVCGRACVFVYVCGTYFFRSRIFFYPITRLQGTFSYGAQKEIE